MLTLSYFLTSSAAPFPSPSPARSLGLIAFGRAQHSTVPVVIAAPVLAAGDATGLLEIWHDQSATQSGQRGALHYRYNECMLFGCMVAAESDFADNAEGTALEQATASAYRQIFALLDDCSLPQLWRVWNFIPRINADDGILERYRQFNSARQAAFVASGRAVVGNVPAASAIGSAAGALTIYFLAGRSLPLAIENPRQVSAYHYPHEYGVRSPVFARANLIAVDATELLFISGTASIVGHRSLHEGDVIAQTHELLANIDAVLTAANEKTMRRKYQRGDLAYKVYLRRAADREPVQGVINPWLGAVADVIYLQADICRAELLVEVEASAGHHTEIQHV